MDCRVEYDYQAQEPDELTLAKGDVINDVITKMDGWWEGTLNGKRGMFPDNFVKVLTSSSTSAEIEFPPNKANAGAAGDDSAVGSTSSVNFRKNSIGNNRRLKALFSYNPEQDDELSLAIGDIVEFISEVEEGWWKGQLNGRTGIFPSNFVANVDTATEISPNDFLASEEQIKPEQQVKVKLERHNSEPGTIETPDVVPTQKFQSNEEEPAPRLPPKPIREAARCFYSYLAQNEDELTLKEGDTVIIISKDCEDEGWWRGELRGKTGLFPDNFVKVVTPNEPVPPSAPFNTKIMAQERLSNNVSKSDLSPAVKTEPPSPGSSTVDGIGHSKINKMFEQDQDLQSGKENALPFSVKGSYPGLSGMKKWKDAPVVPPPPKVAAVTPTSPASPFGGFVPKLYDRGENPAFPLIRSNSGVKSEEKVRAPDLNEFNSVERGDVLNHPTANRAKPPKRRPPSSPNTRDSDPSILNGDYSLDSSNSSTNHNTSVNPNANRNSGPEISSAPPTSDSITHGSNNKDITRDTPGGGSITKPKMVVPWITELKKKQDQKQTPVAQNTAQNSKEAAEPSPSPPSTTTRAPPLPAKPVLPPLPSVVSLDRDRPAAHSPTTLHSQTSLNNNGNPYPNTSNIVNSKNTSNVASKFGGQKKTVTAINNTNIMTNDCASPDTAKDFVSVEEHSALRDKVSALENELEIVKKQLKTALERDFSKGHVV